MRQFYGEERMAKMTPEEFYYNYKKFCSGLVFWVFSGGANFWLSNFIQIYLNYLSHCKIVQREGVLGFWGFGSHLETVVVKSAFLQGLINRSHFEASSQGGRTGRGGEGAHRLGRAGSHGEGANFSTYSPLASAVAEVNGTSHCQKCSFSAFGIKIKNMPKI